MAPNIWSVRPWFFCRAFILPSAKQKLSSKYSPLLLWPLLSNSHTIFLSLCPLSSYPSVFCSFSSCLTVHRPQFVAKPLQPALVLPWHTGNLMHMNNWSWKRGACFCLDLKTCTWTGASEFFPPCSPLTSPNSDSGELVRGVSNCGLVHWKNPPCALNISFPWKLR